MALFINKLVGLEKEISTLNPVVEDLRNRQNRRFDQLERDSETLSTRMLEFDRRVTEGILGRTVNDEEYENAKNANAYEFLEFTIDQEGSLICDHGSKRS